MDDYQFHFLNSNLSIDASFQRQISVFSTFYYSFGFAMSSSFISLSVINSCNLSLPNGASVHEKILSEGQILFAAINDYKPYLK